MVLTKKLQDLRIILKTHPNIDLASYQIKLTEVWAYFRDNEKKILNLFEVILSERLNSDKFINRSASGWYAKIRDLFSFLMMNKQLLMLIKN